jgi:hypothetical protein
MELIVLLLLFLWIANGAAKRSGGTLSDYLFGYWKKPRK